MDDEWERFVDAYARNNLNRSRYDLLRWIGKQWRELSPEERDFWELPPRQILLPRSYQTGCYLFIKMYPDDPCRINQWKLMTKEQKEIWNNLSRI